MQPGRSRSFHRLNRKPLDNEAAHLTQVNQLAEFFAITKGSAGRDDWVFQTDSSDFSGKIDHFGIVDFGLPIKPKCNSRAFVKWIVTEAMTHGQLQSTIRNPQSAIQDVILTQEVGNAGNQ